MKKKSSPLWNFFKIRNESACIATCLFCKLPMSYKSSTSNLKKHLLARHPTAMKRLDLKAIKTKSSSLARCSTSSSHSQQTESDMCDQEAVNKTLMKLFTVDLQPLSMLENNAFQNFVSALNPHYTLPTQDTVANSYLPALYEAIYHNVKKITNEASCVTLAVECWVSSNKNNFLSVTAHFIDAEFQAQSVLLECKCIEDNVTSSNLAVFIKEILVKWNMEGKVILVISNHYLCNIKEAIVDILKLKHLYCFVDTLNLIVVNSLETVESVIGKVQKIVLFFRSNSVAGAELRKFYDTEAEELLLSTTANDWMLTYRMLKQFLELRMHIKTALSNLNTALICGVPNFPESEWEKCENILEILTPFEEVAKYFSKEQHVTTSTTLIIMKGLQIMYQKLASTDPVMFNLIEAIRCQIDKHLDVLENNELVLHSTFLDPRFKDIMFDDNLKMKIKDAFTKLVMNRMEMHDKDCYPMQLIERSDRNSFWDHFDTVVAKHNASITEDSRAVNEIEHYREEIYLLRTEDPLEWWRTIGNRYPNLKSIFLERFLVASSSISLKNISSEAGQILEERRAQFATQKSTQLLFIHYNYKYA